VEDAFTHVDLGVAVQLLVRNKSWSEKTQEQEEKNRKLLHGIQSKDDALAKEQDDAALSIIAKGSSLNVGSSSNSFDSKDNLTPGSFAPTLLPIREGQASIAAHFENSKDIFSLSSNGGGDVSLNTKAPVLPQIEQYRASTLPVRQLRPEGLANEFAARAQLPTATHVLRSKSKKTPSQGSTPLSSTRSSDIQLSDKDENQLATV